MRTKHLLLCLVAVLLSVVGRAQTTVNLSEAGTLKNKGVSAATSLTVTGFIDARDVKYMRDSMAVLAELDLRGVTVVAYEGTEGTTPYNYTYPANEMPVYSFYNDNTNVAKISLATVVWPAGLTSIGDEAFRVCSGLTGSLTLPMDLISIGSSAFAGCSGLTGSLTLPAGLTSIGNSAFNYCIGFTEIINLRVTPVVIDASIFDYVDKSACKLTVPTSSLDLYQAADGWKDFTNMQGGGLSVSAKGNSPLWGNVSSNIENRFYASGEMVNLTVNSPFDFIGWTSKGIKVAITPTLSLSITQDTALIANFARKITVDLAAAGTLKDELRDATTVSHLTLTGYIDARDVQYMRDSLPVLIELNLSGVTVMEYTGTAGTCPSNWGSITYRANAMPQYSFCNYNFHPLVSKTSLITVILPAGLTSIELEAFRGCSGLSSLTLPTGLTSIDMLSFYACSSLSEITNLQLTPPTVSDVFENVNKSTCVLKVPTSSLSLYQAANEWKDFLIEGGGLSVSVLPNSPLRGSVSGIEQRLYTLGETVNLTVAPNLPFDFMNWTSNGVEVATSSTLQVNIMQDTALVANFIRAVTVDVTTAGTLKDNVTYAGTITHLIVTGNIDARDVQFMRDSMTLLKELNLVGTTVVAYTGMEGTYSGRVNYPVNEMPIFSFCYFYNTDYVGKISLTTVVLPAGLTSIGEAAFAGCSSLTSVVLPAGLTSMDGSIFWDCIGLREVVNLQRTPASIYFAVFSGVNKSTCTLKVPTSSLGLYQAANEWKDFLVEGGGLSVLAVPNIPLLGRVSGVERLYQSGETVNLTATSSFDFISWTSNGVEVATTPTLSLCITQDTTLVANFARKVTVNLATAGTLKNRITDAATITHLTITDSIDARDVQYIRDSMTLLKELDIDRAIVVAYSGTEGTRYGSNITYPVNEMPKYSFLDYNTDVSKTSLITVALPASLTSIGDCAFRGCTSLSSLSLPTGLTLIGDQAFFNCSGLSSLTFPVGLTSIGSSSFNGCSGLSGSLILPTNLTSIGNGAFYGCSGLSSLILPAGLTSIGEMSFSYCSGLTEITNLRITPVGLTTYGNAFTDVNKSTCVLKVPTSSIELYKVANGWKDFMNIQGGSELSVSVTGVSLNKTTATVSINGTEQLNATVAPANATNKNVTWSSSNTNIATVSTSGLVTGITAGNVTITVTTADGSKTATCALTVTTTDDPSKQSQTITWNQTLTATIGSAPITLTAMASSNLAVTYTSSNTSVATISGSTLTIVGAGTTNITATQAGNDTYNAAQSVQKVLTVNATATAVSADNLVALTVFPNPAREVLNIAFENEDNYAITLVNMSGVVVLQTSMQGTTCSINATNYPQGIYSLVIENAKKQRTIKKVIIGK